MKIFLNHTLVLFLTVVLGYQTCAQVTPKSKGLDSYRILSSNDTIDFYIYNPKSVKKLHLFIHIDGSLPAPLWIETNPCCVTLDPFNYSLIPDNYAYVVISKHGFKFSDKENFNTPTNFWNKNTLDFRVERVNKVIEYIKKRIFVPEKIIVVGTSQGADVAAKLTTINKDITHLGFWASGGLSQLMEFVLFIRKSAIAGHITEEESVRRIDSLLIQFQQFFDDPSPKKIWDDNSYLSYVSFSEPPINHLVQIDIPIYVAIGTKDENVAVENAYVIPIEFIRQGKKNLTFRHFPNYDHSFMEVNETGQEIDRFDKVTKDFLQWIDKN